MRDVDRGWNGTTLPGPLANGERGLGHRSVGADVGAGVSCRRGLDGEWKMDWTDLVQYRSSSDGEMKMKSILAGEYDCVNVTLRQVAFSGNFTTIWFARLCCRFWSDAECE